MVNKFRASVLTLVVFSFAPLVPGQTPGSPRDKPTEPRLIKLTGDDEKRAEGLDEQIKTALKAGRWQEAIARGAELLGLRTRLQGPKHFETVNAELWLKTLRGAASKSQDDRVAYQSADLAAEQAIKFQSERKYAEAETLFKKAL
jgi:hypothetical protein